MTEYKKNAAVTYISSVDIFVIPMASACSFPSAIIACILLRL